MITAWAIGATISLILLVFILKNDWKVLVDEFSPYGMVFLALCVVLWPVFWAWIICIVMEDDE